MTTTNGIRPVWLKSIKLIRTLFQFFCVSFTVFGRVSATMLRVKKQRIQAKNIKSINTDDFVRDWRGQALQ